MKVKNRLIIRNKSKNTGSALPQIIIPEIIIKTPRIKISDELRHKFLSLDSTSHNDQISNDLTSKFTPSNFETSFRYKNHNSPYENYGLEKFQFTLSREQIAERKNQQKMCRFNVYDKYRSNLLEKLRQKSQEKYKKIEQDAMSEISLLKTETANYKSLLRITRYKERSKMRIRSMHEQWIKKFWADKNNRFIELATPKKRISKNSVIYHKKPRLNKSTI